MAVVERRRRRPVISSSKTASSGQMGPSGTGVEFNAHGDEHWIEAADVNARMAAANGRVRAYVAHGSHGTYKDAGSHTYAKTEALGLEVRLW